MNYQEKLENSMVISSVVRTKTSQGLMTGKKRKRSVFYFLLLMTYTIVNNIILKDASQLGYTSVLIIGNLVTFLMLTFMSKSIFSKQHFKTYKVINFINKACKLGIFIVTFASYIQFYQEYFASHPVEEIAMFHSFTQENILAFFTDVFMYSPVKFIGIVFTIITGVPVLLYFLCVYFMLCLFPLWPFFILRWLFSNSKIFYEYESIDEDHVRVTVRKIKSFGYTFFTFFRKLCILGFVALVITAAYFSMDQITMALEEIVETWN